MKTSTDKTRHLDHRASVIPRLLIAACFLTGCFFTLRALTPNRITVMSEAAASASNENALIPSAVLNHPTPAATPELVTQNIEDIRLGQRVVGTNPLREQTQAASDIDPLTWRAVRLNMIQSGVAYDLAFLRPVSWIESTGAKVGNSIHMELHEMGLDGPAEVVSIDGCPEIEADDGSGRNVVTGTMAHAGANILYLDITGLDEPLGVTDTHPIWSETRQDFVVAGQLEIGEQFRTVTGQSATLTRIHPHRGPPETVFNLEVDGQHVYHVAASGLLVHNSCDWQGSAIGAMSPTHIFSDKHVANGIDSLGTTRTAILEEVGNVLNNVDAQNLLKRGDNQIETVMNGQNATIRAFIDEDGLLRRINLWPGVSSRKLGNVIQW